MTNFQIDIVSDTVCPFCYIGHKKLQKAITQFKAANPNVNHTFQITWMPYYLNPNMPKTSVDKMAFYQAKFGAERTGAIFQRLNMVGKDTGINFKFGGRTGNTRDSHRLVQMAKEKGKQAEVVEQIFATYFENEGDITDHKVLTDAAVKAGLEAAKVKEWLAGNAGGDVVDREAEIARMKGIDGVPNFTINKKHVIGGAQDPSEFVDVFEFIADE